MRIDIGLVLGVFLEYIIMVYYANTTLYSKKNYFASSMIAFAGYFIVLLVAIWGHPIINNVVFLIVNFMIFIMGYSVNCKNAAFKSVVLTLLSFLGEVILIFILNKKLSVNDNISLSVEKSVLITIAGKLIYFIEIFIIKNIEYNRKFANEKSQLTLVFVPVITFISICVILDTEINKQIFIILCLVSIAINILTFAVNEFIMSKDYRIRVLETENIKNRFALEEYMILNERYEENRILRHDMREHIKTIISLLSEDNDRALEYLRKMEEINEGTSDIKYTDNPILNILLTEMYNKCRRMGINLNIKSSNPRMDFIDDMDVVSIFSNLINNAIEACASAETKEIFLDLYTRNKTFTVMKIENTSASEPEAVGQALKTTKTDHHNHGIGIKSVKNSLKKYNGTISWNYDKDNKIFRTTVLFNVKNESLLTT